MDYPFWVQCKVINRGAFRNVFTVFIPPLTLLRKVSRLQLLNFPRPCFLRDVTENTFKVAHSVCDFNIGELRVRKLTGFCCSDVTTGSIYLNSCKVPSIFTCLRMGKVGPCVCYRSQQIIHVLSIRFKTRVASYSKQLVPISTFNGARVKYRFITVKHFQHPTGFRWSFQALRKRISFIAMGCCEISLSFLFWHFGD